MKPRAPPTAETEANDTYAKATKAEHSRDLDAAFRGYLQAANAFLNLSRSSADAGLQSRWRKEAGKALDRAEKIKAVKSDLTPVIKDRFSADEQSLILKRSLVVNGVSTPLWTQPSSSDPDLPTTYIDPDGFLELSPEQLQASVIWRRPADAFPDVRMQISDLRPEDVVQRVVADCSLCASIVVCLLHSRKFQKEDALPTLYPRSPGGNNVTVSPIGQYELRVLFNGAHRRVIIDDQLPFHPDGTLMCMSSLLDHDIWPSIVEKAYLKMMGGYDFPGSNSTLDIHALAGWIPEYVEVKSSTFQREQTWRRLIDGFTKGLCILTLGTSDRGDIQCGGRTLLSAHCYAVIDVREDDDGSCWLTVLDSWLPKETHPTDDSIPIQELSFDNGNQSRAFDMSWDDVCTVMGSVCMSWNPSMFAKQKLFHGTWCASYMSQLDKEDSTHQTLRLIFPPPAAESGRDVWILLTRHRTDTHRAAEYISLQAEFDDGVYEASKTSAQSIKTRGFFTDSPHVLVRTTIPNTPAGGSLSLTASYDGTSDDVGFTITAYSSLDMRWDETVPNLPFDLKVTGALTSKSSGGNYTLPTYMNNPQYRLRVLPTGTSPRMPGPKARMSLRLNAARELPMNVTAVWGKGERVFDLTQKEIVANSGTYGYGYASTIKDFAPGDYTVIVSAFEPGNQGPFTLHVASSHRVQVEPLAQEGAGMFAKIVRGEWSSANRIPRYELTLTAASRVKIRLQCLESKATALNVSLFAALATKDLARLGKPIVTSGPYSDALSGAVTGLVALRPGKYVLVPSTYEGSMEGAFRLVVYSSSAGVGLVPAPA